MDKILLGLDWGKKKIGLAIAQGPLAEPYVVIRFTDEDEVLGKIVKIIKKEKVDRVIVGISSGEIAKCSKDFGNKLAKLANTPVNFQDETLSTKEAQRLSFEAGIKRKKRKSLEDAYSATLILQGYLDNNS